MPQGSVQVLLHVSSADERGHRQGARGVSPSRQRAAGQLGYIFPVYVSFRSFFNINIGRLDCCLLIQYISAGKNMAEGEAPDTCNRKGYSPMCCNNKNDVCVLSSLDFLSLCVSEKRVYLTCFFSSRVPASTPASVSKMLRRLTMRTR